MIHTGYKTKKLVGNIFAYIFLIIISIIWLFPFVGIVLQSFRSYATESGGMESYVIPHSFHWTTINSCFQVRPIICSGTKILL